MDKTRDELLTANALSISEGNYDINNLWIMIENKKFPSLENKGIFNPPPSHLLKIIDIKV